VTVGTNAGDLGPQPYGIPRLHVDVAPRFDRKLYDFNGYTTIVRNLGCSLTRSCP
jgi:hypothetical protein